MVAPLYPFGCPGNEMVSALFPLNRNITPEARGVRGEDWEPTPNDIPQTETQIVFSGIGFHASFLLSNDSYGFKKKNNFFSIVFINFI